MPLALAVGMISWSCAHMSRNPHILSSLDSRLARPGWSANMNSAVLHQSIPSLTGWELTTRLPELSKETLQVGSVWCSSKDPAWEPHIPSQSAWVRVPGGALNSNFLLMCSLGDSKHGLKWLGVWNSHRRIHRKFYSWPHQSVQAFSTPRSGRYFSLSNKSEKLLIRENCS